MKLFESIAYYLGVYKSFLGKRLYIIFALTGAAALTEAFGITLLLPLLETADAESAGSQTGAVTRFIYDFLDFFGAESVVGILLFIGAVFVGKGVLKFSEGVYASYLRAKLMMEIKGSMFNAYRKMGYAYYSRNNTGHFINVINGQVTNFIRSFETFSRCLSMVIISGSYFFFAFLLAWHFSLMAVGAGIILLFLFRSLNSYVQSLSRKSAREESTLNKFLVQTIQSFKYLASTNQMQHLKGGVMQSIRKLSGYMFRQGVASAFTVSIREPASVIFILFVAIIQVAVFNSMIAPIMVVILLFHRAMQHLISIQDDWQRTMERIGSLEMVVEEFEQLEEHKEHDGSRALEPLSRGIRLENVHFRYEENDEDVLKSVDIDIPVNKMIAFVGESGAGKSTLVDMLTLLLRPRKGRVLIDGVDGNEVELASWRSQIGYVSQETVVFDDTIANNICLWTGDYERDEDVKRRVHEAARRAYASDFIEEMPESYQTVVGDRGVRLSGGQRQRLFIARELYKNPNLLILDEATSALDTESERYIQKSIDSLKGSMTVVIIAHRLSTIKNCDTIYVLDKGRILETGSFDELTLNTRSRFSRMVEIQSL